MLLSEEGMVFPTSPEALSTWETSWDPENNMQWLLNLAHPLS